MSIETNPDYWDCECQTNFIHLKKETPSCELCGTRHENQPDSRVEEAAVFARLLEVGAFAKEQKLVLWNKDSQDRLHPLNFWLTDADGEELDGSFTDNLENIYSFLVGYSYGDESYNLLCLIKKELNSLPNSKCYEHTTYQLIKKISDYLDRD